MSNDAQSALVAEDNAGLAHVLRFKLTQLGLDVTVARDGDQAWQDAQERTFDLVITDQQMPGMNGTELLARMRELPQYETTPFVMITAKALELDIKQLDQQLRLAAVFSKPYSPMKLAATVERLLAETN
jgi:two-component system chemotaxis response regulator CheY